MEALAPPEKKQDVKAILKKIIALSSKAESKGGVPECNDGEKLPPLWPYLRPLIGHARIH